MTWAWSSTSTRRPLQDARRSYARRVAAYRVAPFALGAVVGGVAAGSAPCSASETFFSTAAQVIPVLLLALAVELRVFGYAPRFFDPELGKLPRLLERLRLVGAFAIGVAILAGEWTSIDALHGSSGVTRPWPAYLSLGWGFVTVALAAALGPRPRVIATLNARRRGEAHGDKPNEFILEAGAGNEFGDKDVTPVMNLLVSDGTRIYFSDQHGNVDHLKRLTLLDTTERISPDPHARTWHYLDGRPLLSAGDAIVRYSVLALDREEGRVVLRFDHPDLPGGRVQTTLTLRVQASN